MKKLLLITGAAIVLFGCKSNLSHREKINLDSTGRRKPKDTNGIKFEIGKDTTFHPRSFLRLEEGTIERHYELYIRTGKNEASYRTDGKWTVKDTMGTLEEMYNVIHEMHINQSRPFVIITPTDTFNYYHGDTIYIGPDKDFKQIVL